MKKDINTTDTYFRQKLSEYEHPVGDELFENVFLKAKIVKKSSLLQRIFTLKTSVIFFALLTALSIFMLQIYTNKNISKSELHSIPIFRSQHDIRIQSTDYSSKSISISEKSDSQQVNNHYSTTNIQFAQKENLNTKYQKNIDNSSNNNQKEQTQNLILPSQQITAPEFSFSKPEYTHNMNLSEQKHLLASAKLPDISISESENTLFTLNMESVQKLIPEQSVFVISEIPAKSRKYYRKNIYSTELLLINYLNFPEYINVMAKSNEANQTQATQNTNYSVGLLAGLHRGRVFLQTGFMLSSYSMTYASGKINTSPYSKLTTIPNGKPYNYFNNGNYYNIDSTQYWHYMYVSDPNIRPVDSLQAWQIDTVLVNPFDTIIKTQSDTLLAENISFKVKTIEIPIKAGFEYATGRFGVSINISLVPVFFESKEGYYTYQQQKYQLMEGESTIQKFILLAGLNPRLSYNISERILFDVGTELRTLLFSTESNKMKSQKSLGITAGLKYFF